MNEQDVQEIQDVSSSENNEKLEKLLQDILDHLEEQEEKEEEEKQKLLKEQELQEKKEKELEQKQNKEVEQAQKDEQAYKEFITNNLADNNESLTDLKALLEDIKHQEELIVKHNDTLMNELYPNIYWASTVWLVIGVILPLLYIVRSFSRILNKFL